MNDLFEAAYSPTQAPTVDTAEITQLYLNRIDSHIYCTLGTWFCMAHNLNDRELMYQAGSQAIKLMIVRKGYNRLPLAPLEALSNSSHFSKKGKKP